MLIGMLIVAISSAGLFKTVKFFCNSALGSRRAMPAVGRKFNMITDIMRLAETSLQRSFFISKAKNICLMGDCDIYCDHMHPICAEKDIIEVKTPVHIILQKFKKKYLFSYFRGHCVHHFQSLKEQTASQNIIRGFEHSMFQTLRHGNGTRIIAKWSKIRNHSIREIC